MLLKITVLFPEPILINKQKLIKMTIELTQTEIQVIQIALMKYRIETADLILKKSKSNPVLDLITRVELDFLSKTEKTMREQIKEDY